MYIYVYMYAYIYMLQMVCYASTLQVSRGLRRSQGWQNVCPVAWMLVASMWWLIQLRHLQCYQQHPWMKMTTLPMHCLGELEFTQVP